MGKSKGTKYTTHGWPMGYAPRSLWSGTGLGYSCRLSQKKQILYHDQIPPHCHPGSAPHPRLQLWFWFWFWHCQKERLEILNPIVNYIHLINFHCIVHQVNFMYICWLKDGGYVDCIKKSGPSALREGSLDDGVACWCSACIPLCTRKMIFLKKNTYHSSLLYTPVNWPFLREESGASTLRTEGWGSAGAGGGPYMYRSIIIQFSWTYNINNANIMPDHFSQYHIIRDTMP